METDRINAAINRAQLVIDGLARPTTQNARDVIALAQHIAQLRSAQNQDSQNQDTPQEPGKKHEMPDALKSIFGKF